MSRVSLALLLLGLLVVSQYTLARAEDEYDEEEEVEAATAGDDEEKDVVVLTNDNFEDYVKKKKFALVEFYAPWCGHCKALKPEYAKAATVLKAYDADIVVGKVDATVEKDIAKNFEVNGYPTIKWFVDGEPTEYGGGRQSDDIVRWVKKKTGPPAIRLENAEKVEEALEGDSAFVLGFFDKFEGDAYEAFVDAARLVDDAEIFETTDKKIASKLTLTKPGYAIARKSFGEWEFETGHSDDKETITEFIKNEIVPVYVAYSQDTHSKIFGAETDYFVFLFGSEDQIAAAEVDVVKPVIKKYKGKLLLVSIKIDDDSAQGIMNFFLGSEKPSELTSMAWQKETNKKFKAAGDITKESYVKFLDSLVAGTAEAFFKSEPIPDEPTDSDGVTKVVGKNFESIVLDPTKDVLLEVYAPWCGHCKSLAPTWKKLGKRFKKVDSVVIAQFDGTANEHPDLSVQGFPTIKFYPAGEDKQAVSYDGERNLKDFTKWLKKNAKVPFELPKKSKKGEDAADVKDEL